jgi:hypothetical protein
MDEDEKTEDESEREYRHPRPPFLIFSPVQVQRCSSAAVQCSPNLKLQFSGLSASIFEARQRRPIRACRPFEGRGCNRDFAAFCRGKAISIDYGASSQQQLCGCNSQEEGRYEARKSLFLL